MTGPQRVREVPSVNWGTVGTVTGNSRLLFAENFDAAEPA
jgi:hypothetical protein